MYEWYKLINLNDFDAKGTPDDSFTSELQDRGLQSFRLCKGVLYSLIVDGIFLSVGLNGRNAFNKDGRSAYIDSERNLWVGYEAAN